MAISGSSFCTGIIHLKMKSWLHLKSDFNLSQIILGGLRCILVTCYISSNASGSPKPYLTKKIHSNYIIIYKCTGCITTKLVPFMNTFASIANPKIRMNTFERTQSLQGHYVTTPWSFLWLSPRHDTQKRLSWRMNLIRSGLLSVLHTYMNNHVFWS